MDLTTLVPDNWAGALILILVTLILGPFAIFSKESSSKWWALGRFTRWVRGRRIREIEENSRLADATIKGHADDRARWISQMQDLREEMRKDRERFRSDMSTIAEEAASYWAYIIYVTNERRELDLMAVKYSWQPKPPPLPTFEEWKAQNEK